MADMVEVKALRAHRNGYAPGGKAAKDDVFAVPADRVAAMKRQKLVALPQTETKSETADEDDDQG